MFSKHDVVPHAIARWAQEAPDRVFLKHVDGDSLTYAQFHTAALTWADAFRRIGVGAGDPVLIMMPTSVDAYIAPMGLAWNKALQVPVNTDYRGSMLSYLINHTGARAMLCSERYLDRLAHIAGEIEGKLETVVVPDATGELPADVPAGRVITLSEFLAEATPATDLPGPEIHDPASIIYTSGTTGPSKGVLTTWAFAREGSRGYWPLCKIQPDPDDVYYVPFPSFHSSGAGQFMAVALAGCRMVIREYFRTDEWHDDIYREGATHTFLLGAMAHWIHSQPERPEDAQMPLKYVFMVPVLPQIEEFKQRFGVKVYTMFGSSDGGAVIVSDWVDESNFRAAGKVREGYEIRIVDEHDNPLGPGEVGEAIIRANDPWVMMQGYHKMPEQTLAAWRNLWFHTGDGMRYDEDGNFYFVDRIKDAIRRRGENISSFEVEAIVNQHPAVAESCAIAVPSEYSEDEIKVCVVLKPDAEFDPADLIQFLVPRMPRFMIPRYVEVLDDLPKTQTAKVRKVELRENPFSDATWDREAAGIELPR